MNAISCQTKDENSSVHYEVYLLPNNYSNPEDGLLVASGDKIYEFAGFHRINLEDDLIYIQNESKLF